MGSKTLKVKSSNQVVQEVLVKDKVKYIQNHSQKWAKSEQKKQKYAMNKYKTGTQG